MIHPNFRADHVGSLLRPPELLQARHDVRDGRITQEQLKAVEDRSILTALDLLRQCVAKDWFIFQSMLRGSRTTPDLEPDYPFWERAVFDKPGFPKMHFIENSYSNDPTNWWIPNRSCAEAVLRSAGFRIESIPEPEVFICRCDDAAVLPTLPVSFG